MDSLNPVLQPLLRVWGGLGRGQRIGLGAIGVALVGLLLVVSTIGHGADSAVAFSGLSTDDEAAIVQKLKDAKIPYELVEGGTIRVATGEVQAARLATAGMGLGGKPATGSGFELFNQPSFGQTEFTQKINYQRALETELARSIDQMDAVDTAGVHLVMPTQSLFATQQQPTTASVILKLKPGKRLDAAQARSISNLVAGSVEGLKTQNLTIVDVNGNTLSADNSSDATASGLTTKQLDAQRGYEIGHRAEPAGNAGSCPGQRQSQRPGQRTDELGPDRANERDLHAGRPDADSDPYPARHRRDDERRGRCRRRRHPRRRQQQRRGRSDLPGCDAAAAPRRRPTPTPPISSTNRSKKLSAHLAPFRG